MSDPRAAVGRNGRVDGLDVARGIAISLVLLRHAAPDLFPGAGVAGVVVFFALSGYLITGVLLREGETHRAVRLRSFYARRFRRLVPALALMVAVLALVTLAIDPIGDRHELARTVVIALTYTADLPIQHGSAATFHLWTLAVEEQFYLVWPALLAFAWRRRRLRALVLAGGVACVSACVAVLLWLAPEYELAYPLPTRGRCASSSAPPFGCSATAEPTHRRDRRPCGRRLRPRCWQSPVSWP